MTQEEFINQILNLKRANPSMDIHFCMHSDDDYQYGWVPHQISEVKICPWFEAVDNILTDEYEIKGYLEDEYCRHEDRPCVAMKKVNDEYAKIKKAICVFTEAI